MFPQATRQDRKCPTWQANGIDHRRPAFDAGWATKADERDEIQIRPESSDAPVVETLVVRVPTLTRNYGVDLASSRVARLDQDRDLLWSSPRRRSRAWMRLTSSVGLNGFVT